MTLPLHASTSGRDMGPADIEPQRPAAPQRDVGATMIAIAVAPPLDAGVGTSGSGPAASAVDAGIAGVERPDGAVETTQRDARAGGRDAGTASGETGTLSVSTEPPTQVYLDDQPLGLTPFAGRQVPAGRHRLRFVSEAFGIRRDERITILAGRDTTIRRTADQLRGPPETVAPAAGMDAGRTGDGFRLMTTYGADAR
jgi:hypothetical protein